MSESISFLEKLANTIGRDLVEELRHALYHGSLYEHIGVTRHTNDEGIAVIVDTSRKISVYFTKNGNEVTFTNFEIEDKHSQTPTHYGTDKTDTITYMKQHCSHEEVRGFLKGNVMKYLTRAEKKNGLEDYKKVAHYMTLLLDWEEKGGATGSI